MRRKSYSKNRFSWLVKILGITLITVSILAGLYFLKPRLTDVSINPDSSSSLLAKISSYARSFISSDTGFTQYVKSLIGEEIETQPIGINNSLDHQDRVLIGRIAVLSDSHASTETFQEVIKRVRSEEVSLILHLGDVSAGGELTELQGIKKVLDNSRIEYYVLPGDHDYNWVPEYDLSNFTSTFASNGVIGTVRLIEFEGISLILFDNSGKNTNSIVIRPLIGLLDSLHENTPIYLFTVSPFTNPYFETKQDFQGLEVLKELSRFNIKQIFSGDTHIYSRYTDDSSGITTTTVGATGDYKNPLPQYVIVEFFDNGEFEIKSKPAVDLESVD